MIIKTLIYSWPSSILGYVRSKSRSLDQFNKKTFKHSKIWNCGQNIFYFSQNACIYVSWVLFDYCWIWLKTEVNSQLDKNLCLQVNGKWELGHLVEHPSKNSTAALNLKKCILTKVAGDIFTDDCKTFLLMFVFFR